jgi:kynurenine formamidase
MDERLSIAWRKKPKHEILFVGHEARGVTPGGCDDPSHGFNDLDDYIDGLWLQGSSQWDGLTHIRHPEHGNYNGVPDSDIHGGPGTKLGVDQWSERGIVGRGLLLDVAKYLADLGRPIHPESNYGITADDLEATASAQGEEILSGDIILFRTGWLGNFLSKTDEQRAAFMAAGLTAPGLATEERTVAFLWDKQVAAVASDTMGVEQHPASDPSVRWPMHRVWLPLIGMPLGEYWRLDELAEDCATDGRYAFLLTSAPLNIRGGVGSPPNAIALK